MQWRREIFSIWNACSICLNTSGAIHLGDLPGITRGICSARPVLMMESVGGITTVVRMEPYLGLGSWRPGFSKKCPSYLSHWRKVGTRLAQGNGGPRQPRADSDGFCFSIQVRFLIAQAGCERILTQGARSSALPC